jgi:hypothetical protein
MIEWSVQVSVFDTAKVLVSYMFNSAGSTIKKNVAYFSQVLISRPKPKQIYFRFVTFAVFCMGVKLGLLILREEHRLRMFENRMLRRVFGSEER